MSVAIIRQFSTTREIRTIKGAQL